jgi:hypothetical protein
LLGNGDGTFLAAQSCPAGTFPGDAIAVGDFNGDGIPDLAVTIRNTSSPVTILLGNGDGSFRVSESYGAGSAVPDSVVVGDFNEDGSLDLAVANNTELGPNSPGSPTVSILLGGGDGTFQRAQNYPAAHRAPFSLAAADFNRDGHLDIAVADGQAVTVMLGNGDGTFQPAAAQNYVVPLAISVAVADFNGDGFPDIAALGGNGILTVLINTADW